MWKRAGSLLLCCCLLLMLVAPTASAAPWEVACAKAAAIPACGWCMTQCVFAIMADMWNGGSISWDWGAR